MALGSFSSCTIVLVLSNNETQLEDPIPTHGNQEQPMQCSTTHAQGQRTGIHSAGKQGRQKALSLSILAAILASLTSITEEHTKLLDHLSEPSSQLIHCISHPLKEDVSAEVLNSCFICVQVHGFASCVPTFCKKDLSVTITAKKPYQK